MSSAFPVAGLPADVRAPWSSICAPTRITAIHSPRGKRGAPSPSEKQYRLLQDAGQLQLLNSPAWQDVKGQALPLQVPLPRQAISLLRLAYAYIAH